MTTDPVNSRGGGMSKRALARALGLSPSAVLKLEARGMPLDSVEAARAWRAVHLDPMRTKASGARAERIGRADALMAARIEREQAEAALARLKLAEQRGELVRVAGIRLALARKFVSIRDSMLNLPHRLAATVAAEQDQARVFMLIDREVRMVLELLSQGDAATTPQDDTPA
jgi:phage terminase Nu1 subunit (DNA packaging protein)